MAYFMRNKGNRNSFVQGYDAMQHVHCAGPCRTRINFFRVSGKYESLKQEVSTDAIRVNPDFGRSLKALFLIFSWPATFAGGSLCIITQTLFRVVKSEWVRLEDCSRVAFETFTSWRSGNELFWNWVNILSAKCSYYVWSSNIFDSSCDFIVNLCYCYLLSSGNVSMDS